MSDDHSNSHSDSPRQTESPERMSKEARLEALYVRLSEFIGVVIYSRVGVDAYHVLCPY